MAHSQWSDPLAMAMYGVALLPLITLAKDDMVTQKWYADDGNAVGSLESLVALHQKLQKHGPAFGYKLTKCNLIVKESSLEKANNSQHLLVFTRRDNFVCAVRKIEDCGTPAWHVYCERVRKS